MIAQRSCLFSFCIQRTLWLVKKMCKSRKHAKRPSIATYRRLAFPRLAAVVCFPALGVSHTFSRSWHRLHVFIAYMFIFGPAFTALFAFVMIGQMWCILEQTLENSFAVQNRYEENSKWLFWYIVYLRTSISNKYATTPHLKMMLYLFGM